MGNRDVTGLGVSSKKFAVPAGQLPGTQSRNCVCGPVDTSSSTQPHAEQSTATPGRPRLQTCQEGDWEVRNGHQGV